jgi:hypothetical protein
MSDHQADSRSLHFAGDIDELGRPLPMSVEALRARTEKWPVSERTPADVAALLARSRQMFVDGYYTYENFMDATTRSLQAVESGSPGAPRRRALAHFRPADRPGEGTRTRRRRRP